jgi:DNA-binding transcriptional MerR regulator
MNDEKTNTAAAYPIGVAARMTRIHPETLRIWERRYRMIQPARAGRGRRLYSEQDIHRLSLVKSLVDEGNPISVVAQLSVEELERRLQARNSSTTLTLPVGPCRVVTIGEQIPRLTGDLNSPIAVLTSYPDVAAAEGGATEIVPDVLVWARPSLHSDTLSQTQSLLSRTRAKRAVLIYGYGSRRALAEMEAAGVRCIRAPAKAEDVVALCLGPEGAGRSALQVSIPSLNAIPPRRFTASQLARIAESSPNIACECPHHLADLVNRLVAFEIYSAECESRSPADASVHALLHAITATARALMESGLERVARAEGISLD